MQPGAAGCPAACLLRGSQGRCVRLGRGGRALALLLLPLLQMWRGWRAVAQPPAMQYRCAARARLPECLMHLPRCRGHRHMLHLPQRVRMSGWQMGRRQRRLRVHLEEGLQPGPQFPVLLAALLPLLALLALLALLSLPLFPGWGMPVRPSPQHVKPRGRHCSHACRLPDSAAGSPARRHRLAARPAPLGRVRRTGGVTAVARMPGRQSAKQ